jgi:hypothetical protein
VLVLIGSVPRRAGPAGRADCIFEDEKPTKEQQSVGSLGEAMAMTKRTKAKNARLSADDASVRRGEHAPRPKATPNARTDRPKDLSLQDLAEAQGGYGLGFGMFTNVVKQRNPAGYQAYMNNLKDPIGLGDVISGAFDHNAKEALGGLANLVTSIPGGAIGKIASTAVRTGVQVAKAAGTAYKATK